MPRVVIGDLLTGRRIVELPFVSYRWDVRPNTPESLSVVVDLNDPDVRILDLDNTATPGKTILAIVEDAGGAEWFPGAGPMDTPRYDRDAGRLELTASGVWAYWDDRTVLPASARTIDPTLFVIPDPADGSKTIPNPALFTQWSGVEYGTIVKRLVQQTQTWPNSSLPIVFEADRVGTRTSQPYQGTDFKRVGEAISDITKYQNGPDVKFQARYQTDRRGIEWLLRTGTDDSPRLSSTSVHRWDTRTPDSGVKGLTVSYSSAGLGSVWWNTGGRGTDAAIVERATSTMLTDAGYPLREGLDSTRTDVSDRGTLQRYANDNLTRAQTTTEQWTFQVRKQDPPYIGQYDVGDYCNILTEGDPYITDGPHRRQIIGLSGDEGDWITVTTAAS